LRIGIKNYHTNNSAGVDDVLAILLALSASLDELEVVMISVTYGNVQLQRYVGQRLGITPEAISPDGCPL
jgi:inosine-uridine nucleoside N-ribohydrolase